MSFLALSLGVTGLLAIAAVWLSREWGKARAQTKLLKEENHALIEEADSHARSAVSTVDDTIRMLRDRAEQKG